MSVIEVNHLSKSYRLHRKEPGLKGSIKSLFQRHYEEIIAVHNISFYVEEGEFLGLIGPNGAGKTTTLKLLSGILHPTHGEAHVLGFTPWQRSEDFLRCIGFVMAQKGQLWWDIPPLDTFLLNKEVYGIPANEFDRQLDEMVTMLEIGDRIAVQARKLSFGERMKCEIIASLLHNPDIIFLDEPTIGLDIVSQKQIWDFLKRYNRQYRKTIILTSHYLGDVKKLCDRVIMISQGEIAYDGALSTLIHRYAPFKTLTIHFADGVPTREAIESHGELLESLGDRVVLRVNREDTETAIMAIASKFEIYNLLVEEPQIEDVMVNIFANLSPQA
ncbi:MAG: ATP-binding cassette domain-containing protein [Chloroflexota bacterium]